MCASDICKQTVAAADTQNRQNQVHSTDNNNHNNNMNVYAEFDSVDVLDLHGGGAPQPVALTTQGVALGSTICSDGDQLSSSQVLSMMPFTNLPKSSVGFGNVPESTRGRSVAPSVPKQIGQML